MKHKITIVVCAVAVAAISAVSAVSYHHYQTWAAQQSAKATAASAAERKASLAQQVVFNHELSQLEAQCASDKAAYAALPAAQKAKTPVPTCSTNLVQ